jgi:hypothetical protein
MTRTTSTLRLFTVGTLLGGALLAAGCSGPEKIATTTTTEQTTTAQPAPVTSTTTTTTKEIGQSH